MAVLMGLAQNGQSINLSAPLKAAGVTDAEALRASACAIAVHA